MRLKPIMTFVCILSMHLANSQTLETQTFGKGILNLKSKDSSWTMKFATRMQILGIAQWDKEGGSYVNPEQNFLIRRARLKFDGYAYSPKLVYKIEVGLSNRDISGGSEFTGNSPRYILDAVIKYNFYENFVLWVGQTKLPGNRERVISSGNLSLVDRSLVNSRFNIDRDIGLQLRHKTNLTDKFVMKEIIALSQGEGRNVTAGNLGGHQYTGRLELFPFGEFEGKGDYIGSDLKREEYPKLSLAATYDINKDAVRNRSNLGRYMLTDQGFYETDISTLFIDTMFKYKGVSIMAEYADRTADDPIAKNSDGTPTGDVVQVGKGLNLQAGYLFKSNWEVTGRYTTINLDENITNTAQQDQYTLGLSKFIVGHKLKVQSDISYTDNHGRNDGLMFRLQMDVHF